MLEIRGLRHEYGGRTVLDVPAWEVAAGEASLVLGPSGSGKSTLLGVISGLLTPTAGEVRVAGENVPALPAARRDAYRARHVGIVLQTLHLIAVVSVRENLRLAQRLAGHAVDDARIDAVLDGLGIAALAARRARELSLGEAQRVAIARAVVNRPALLLADEPTSALDDANCGKAIALLQEQARACGAALVVATHDHRIRARFTRELAL